MHWIRIGFHLNEMMKLLFFLVQMMLIGVGGGAGVDTLHRYRRQKKDNMAVVFRFIYD